MPTRTNTPSVIYIDSINRLNMRQTNISLKVKKQFTTYSRIQSSSTLKYKNILIEYE
jgi:hypothetical protein